MDLVNSMGLYFDYPICCIEWFLEHRWNAFPDVTPLTPKQDAAHGYRGFIPCPTCAEKITHDTIDTLIKDRICPAPFPMEL